MAQVHGKAGAAPAYAREMFASSLCILVRSKSWSFADAQFELAHQQVMICRHSGLFARCRAICCDSVATDRTKRDAKMAGGSGLTRGAIFLTQRSIDALSGMLKTFGGETCASCSISVSSKA